MLVERDIMSGNCHLIFSPVRGSVLHRQNDLDTPTATINSPHLRDKTQLWQEFLSAHPTKSARNGFLEKQLQEYTGLFETLICKHKQMAMPKCLVAHYYLTIYITTAGTHSK